MNIRGTRIAVGTSVVAALIAFGGPSKGAPESVQKQCGEEWAAAKKAGTVPAGQAWPGFLGECRKRHSGDTAAAKSDAKTPETKAPETKTTPAAAKTTAPVAKTTPPPTPPAAPPKAEAKADLNETCKSEYNAGKTSGAVPKGTNYFKYLSDCKKRHASDATAPTVAPPKPTAAAPATAAPTTNPAPTTAAKTPATGGREAFFERERTCGAKWKTIKGTAALPAGITTWPKYLSYCNTRLKAGQSI